MENAKNIFGERLRMARISAGWTQQGLATAMGICTGTVSRWERSIHAPIKIERRLAKLLKVSWAWLMGGTETNEAPECKSEASNSAR